MGATQALAPVSHINVLVGKQYYIVRNMSEYIYFIENFTKPNVFTKDLTAYNRQQEFLYFNGVLVLTEYVFLQTVLSCSLIITLITRIFDTFMLGLNVFL